MTTQNQVTVALPTDGKQSQALAVLETAKALRVTTDVEYREAGSFLQQIKANFAELENERKDWKRPIDALAKKIQTLFQPTLDVYEQAERAVKAAMVAYTNEQERLRREEQRRLDEAAQKERDRKAAEAREAERKAREKAEADRRAAEAARAAGDVAKAEKLEQRADATQARGEEKAANLQAAAASVVAPVISREPPKVAGISSRENWYAECSDLMALVKAVAEGRASISYVMANDKLLGQQARSLKDHFVCDGVRVWSDKGLAAGAA